MPEAAVRQSRDSSGVVFSRAFVEHRFVKLGQKLRTFRPRTNMKEIGRNPGRPGLMRIVKRAERMIPTSRNPCILIGANQAGSHSPRWKNCIMRITF